MKIKTQYTCNACGYQSVKWLGKCPECHAWNTFTEESYSAASQKRETAAYYSLSSDKPLALDEISTDSITRYQTAFSELDRVLGGGVVPGSLVLLGGDPGIGKSTLVLEILNNLNRQNIATLYVTGEESKEQIKIRAERLGISGNILVVAENSLEKILDYAKTIKPQVLVIDSIQTVYQTHLESAPGSVSQVRECTGQILYFSKTTATATFLIGHVTKEGSIAGPRVLEHMVDTVLYFEGEASGQFRILRTIKNRFGSTNEIGVFEMASKGLVEVSNPSEYFLSGKYENKTGSCITASLEGTRPILTEIQSLVSSSQLANPRRTALGLDHNRISLIVAVLEKIVGINLYNQDIYVNVVGGLKLSEPSSDIAILISLISSFQNKPLSGSAVAVGEMGLNGEIRAVSFVDLRIREAEKLGYKTIIVPHKNKISEKCESINVLRFNNIVELTDGLF
ncbi:MAG: DNA repair protein RadA [Deltaproteobacteria bacterium]|nr:DNA repair protein RadA [Deltaproteobacteria bacterium]